ncbi:hypothetical protein C0995_008138 [Termitomyces sp. Mi166|nr:hypothetical protein C0995_008138 [Termitomyces sp. Mi166\
MRPSNIKTGSSRPGERKLNGSNKLSDKQVAEYKAENRCFSCGKVGHFTQNCTHSKTAKSSLGKPPELKSNSIQMDLREVNQMHEGALEGTTQGLLMGCIGIGRWASGIEEPVFIMDEDLSDLFEENKKDDLLDLQPVSDSEDEWYDSCEEPEEDNTSYSLSLLYLQLAPTELTFIESNVEYDDNLSSLWLGSESDNESNIIEEETIPHLIDDSGWGWIDMQNEENHSEEKSDFFELVHLSPPVNFDWPKGEYDFEIASSEMKLFMLWKEQVYGKPLTLESAPAQKLEYILELMQPYPGDPSNCLQYKEKQFDAYNISNLEMSLWDQGKWPKKIIKLGPGMQSNVPLNLK